MCIISLNKAITFENIYTFIFLCLTFLSCLMLFSSSFDSNVFKSFIFWCCYVFLPFWISLGELLSFTAFSMEYIVYVCTTAFETFHISKLFMKTESSKIAANFQEQKNRLFKWPFLKSWFRHFLQIMLSPLKYAVFLWHSTNFFWTICHQMQNEVFSDSIVASLFSTFCFLFRFPIIYRLHRLQFSWILSFM